MKICNFCRALLVLILAPVLTLLISVLSCISLFFFRVSARTVQVFPRTWARIIIFCTGVKVEVEGGSSLQPGGPCIFAANHQSQFDIFALQGYLQADFRWLAKKELFKIPVFGPALRMAGHIAVDRSQGRQALKSLEKAADRIAAGTSVVVFPEGTRSPDGQLLPFKSGAMVLAIKAGVPIVPVAISGTHYILPKHKLLARPGKVKISIGRPIETKGLKSGQKQALAQQVQDAVAAMLV